VDLWDLSEVLYVDRTISTCPRQRKRENEGPAFGDASQLLVRLSHEYLSWGNEGSRNHRAIITIPIFVTVAAMRACIIPIIVLIVRMRIR